MGYDLIVDPESDLVKALLRPATDYCWRCGHLLPENQRNRYAARCASEACKEHRRRLWVIQL